MKHQFPEFRNPPAMRFLRLLLTLGMISARPLCASASLNWKLLTTPSKSADCVTIVAGQQTTAIVVDTNDFSVVSLAANLFADDVRRVTDHRPAIANTPANASQLIIVGTLGHSATIDALAAMGKLRDLNQIKGHWEATLWQIVEKPFPNVGRALVIVGSDRRGAAYGLMRLSEEIGVSPWYWWADVPATHHHALAIKISSPQMDAPGVKYRGIFINDEDWGLNPWASKTFDPEFGNIGPKTYEKVFQLLLRLRLNYIWPAMHACSREFASAPENIALADKFGIVAGSSHCEPMLCNNVHWNEREKGKWNYSLNRDAIHSYWEQSVTNRAMDEAVWTVGIRGIHDAGMETPPTGQADRIDLLTQVITDQRELLDQNVTKRWGPVAQCFVPYKEVLPLYDAGLKVPDDVTIVWVDDNFGYIRRLGLPSERKRSGGAGIYWHMSYFGNPHSYTWINTTAPAFMWEELHKAWQNDARTLWVINVGDIKPGEIGINYFSRLAWDPEGIRLGGQREFLREFTARNFGQKLARPLTDFLMQYYHLGTIRKPELMERAWALSLSPDRAKQLQRDYQDLLKREEALAASVPANARDAYTEMIGFPARVMGKTGLIFLADRSIQLGDRVAENEKRIASLRDDLESQVKDFNTTVAGGKWNHIMPGLMTVKWNMMSWASQVRWPWGEPTNRPVVLPKPAVERTWRDAATADDQTTSGAARWAPVEGLGPSGRAMALEPSGLESSWGENATNAPTLEYRFKCKAGDAEAFIDFLPTFRICPGMKLRVAVSVDGGAPTLVEVPGSSGAENENGSVRRDAVQDNYVRLPIPLPNLTSGQHTFAVRAVDPGAVIDSVSLP